MKTLKNCFFILCTIVQFSAFAQVPNSNFNLLNSDGTLANWGNVYIFQAWLDTNGVMHSDSIVFDGPFYGPTTDAYSGSHALELHNAWNYTSNIGIAGAVASDEDSVFSSWGILNLVPTNASAFNPFAPFNFGFHYKFFPANGDTAYALLTLYDSLGISTGECQILLTDSTQTYTEIYAPVVYTSTAPAAYYSLRFSNFYTATPGYKQPSLGTHLLIDQIGFNLVTSVEQQSAIAQNTIQLVPNPAGNQLRIQLASNEAVRARVLSLLGTELIPLQSSNILDLENLKAGIYLLEVSTNETKQVLRFVKE